MQPDTMFLKAAPAAPDFVVSGIGRGSHTIKMWVWLIVR